MDSKGLSVAHWLVDAWIALEVEITVECTLQPLRLLGLKKRVVL